jgi:hypothetical protein
MADRLPHSQDTVRPSVGVRRLSPDRLRATRLNENGQAEAGHAIQKAALRDFCLSLAQREAAAAAENGGGDSDTSKVLLSGGQLEVAAAALEARREDWDVATYEEYSEWAQARVVDEQQWRRSVLRGCQTGSVLEPRYWPPSGAQAGAGSWAPPRVGQVASSSSHALELNKLLTGVARPSEDEAGGGSGGERSRVGVVKGREGRSSVRRRMADDTLHAQMHQLLRGSPRTQAWLMRYLARSEARHSWDVKRGRRVTGPPHCCVLRVHSARGLQQDVLDMADPYVRVSLDGQLLGQTDTCSDTLTPQWLHEFPLLLHSDVEHEIKVEIFDFDDDPDDHDPDFMGQCCFTGKGLSCLPPRPPPEAAGSPPSPPSPRSPLSSSFSSIGAIGRQLGGSWHTLEPDPRFVGKVRSILS